MTDKQIDELFEIANILHVLAAAGEYDECSSYSMGEVASFLEKKLLNFIETVQDENDLSRLASAPV